MPQTGVSRITWKLAYALAVVAVVLSAFFLERLSQFSVHCFDSSLIERVVFFSDESEIPRCDRLSNWLTDHDPKWVRRSRTLNQVAAEAERFLEVWPRPRLGYRMIVVDQDPFFFERHENQILIGAGLIDQKQVWLKAVMEAWVDDTVQRQDPEARSILVWFFQAVMNGKFIDPSPFGTGLLSSRLTWPTLPRAGEYCLSPLRRLSDLNHCDAHLQDSKEHWVTPLLAKGLWRIYRRANWAEQRRFWQWLREDIAQGRELLLVPGSSSKGSEFIEAEWHLSRWAAKILRRPDVRTLVLHDLERELGFEVARRPEVLIETDEVPIAEPDQPALLKTGGQTFWWSRQGLFPVTDAVPLPAHRILITCHKPTLESLLASARRTVLVVLACDPGQLRGWESLGRGDLSAFVAGNPRVGMIWFDANSLRRFLTDRRSGRQAGISLRGLRQWSQWREDRWDPRLGAFKPRAVIDLVLSHRATRDLL